MPRRKTTYGSVWITLHEWSPLVPNMAADLSCYKAAPDSLKKVYHTLHQALSTAFVPDVPRDRLRE